MLFPVERSGSTKEFKVCCEEAGVVSGLFSFFPKEFALKRRFTSAACGVPSRRDDLTIARSFNCGWRVANDTSPAGTAEPVRFETCKSTDNNESQRDSGSKPRVAPPALPWVMVANGPQPQRGCGQSDDGRHPSHNPFGIAKMVAQMIHKMCVRWLQHRVEMPTMEFVMVVKNSVSTQVDYLGQVFGKNLRLRCRLPIKRRFMSYPGLWRS